MAIINDHIFFWCSHGFTIHPPTTEKLRNYLVPFSNVSNIRFYTDNGALLYEPKFMHIFRDNPLNQGRSYNMTYQDIIALFNGTYMVNPMDPSGNPIYDPTDTSGKRLLTTAYNNNYIELVPRDKIDYMYELPPVLFVAKETDKQKVEFVSMMGFWHVNNKTQTLTKIMDIDDIINATNKYTYISYDYIRLKMAYYINNNINLFINSNNIGLGLFTCREYINMFDFKQDINYNVERNINYLEYNKEVDLSNLIISETELSRLYRRVDINNNKNKRKIKTNIYFYHFELYANFEVPIVNDANDLERFIKNRWRTLADITRQGCALNVLSYWGFIPTEIATEETICLTQGTSIYKIISILINFFRIINYDIGDAKFIILRFEFNVDTLMRYILSFTNYINQIIIIKLYDVNPKLQFINDYNQPFDKGQTVSFFYTTISNNECVYLIDPQLQIYELIFINYQPTIFFNNWIDGLLKRPILTFDTIWVVRNTDSPSDHSLLYKISDNNYTTLNNDTYRNPIKYQIIDYNNIKYGGQMFRKKNNRIYKQKGSSNKQTNINTLLQNLPIIELTDNPENDSEYKQQLLNEFNYNDSNNLLKGGKHKIKHAPTKKLRGKKKSTNKKTIKQKK